MKATIKAFVLLMLIQTAAGALTQPDESLTPEQVQLERRWREIVPDLFTNGAGNKYVGAKIRFRAGPFANIKAGPPVTIKSSAGVTARISNVSKADRTDIATPHKPPMIVSVEGIITGVDAATKTVSIKATKVIVTW